MARWLVRGANLLYTASVIVAAATLAEGLGGRPGSWVAALVGVACSLWLTDAGLDALAAIARARAGSPHAEPDGE
jgi:hypothetical protein